VLEFINFFHYFISLECHFYDKPFSGFLHYALAFYLLACPRRKTNGKRRSAIPFGTMDC